MAGSTLFNALTKAGIEAANFPFCRGEGLGNKFLAHIREVDAICHVVRCFEHPDVIHVANRVDPIADIETIDTELALADLESVEKAIARYERVAKSGDKDAKAKIEVLGKLRAALDAGKAARTVALDEEEKAAVRELFLLTLRAGDVHRQRR